MSRRTAAAEIGSRAHIAAITERAMRGDIAFEPALRERVALLKGLDLATIIASSPENHLDAGRASLGSNDAGPWRAYRACLGRLFGLHIRHRGQDRLS